MLCVRLKYSTRYLVYVWLLCVQLGGAVHKLLMQVCNGRSTEQQQQQSRVELLKHMQIIAIIIMITVISI